MTIASRLTGLAFAAVATAAGATNSDAQIYNKAVNTSTSVGPHATQVSGDGGNATMTISDNRPVEKSLHLGDCEGIVYQALFKQFTQAGATEVKGKVLFGSLIGPVSVNLSHAPNLIHMDAESFTLSIPGGPIQDEAERLRVGEEIAQNMLIKNFVARQAVAPVNVNTVDASTSISATTTEAVSTTSTNVNTNTGSEKSITADVSTMNVSAMNTSVVSFPQHRDMHLKLTCTSAPTNDMK